MRDLIFMLAPVALIIYFVVFPDQFGALLGRSVRALADRSDAARNNFRAPAAAVTGRGAISPT
jgi:hypothetical protein